MFDRGNDEGYVLAIAGILRKTLAYGERTLMTEFRLERDSVLPPHAHPHEQIGYLISGRMRLTIGGEEHDVRPGDSWCIPGDAEHTAQALEPSVAVEVFSPVREDYLP
jgi:quercetin dioxygenase-like cupin family protein